MWTTNPVNAKQLQYAPDTFSKQFETLTPFSGQVVPLAQTDDPFFKNGYMGPGAAVTSTSNTIVAPFVGKVLNVSPLDYAIDIQSKVGLKCRIKYGGDTCHLHGAQFNCALKRGDTFNVSPPAPSGGRKPWPASLRRDASVGKARACGISSMAWRRSWI